MNYIELKSEVMKVRDRISELFIYNMFDGPDVSWLEIDELKHLLTVIDLSISDLTYIKLQLVKPEIKIIN